MSRGPGPYSPPPGQGHHPASGYDDRHRRESQQHFDPPPTSAYEDFEGSRDAYQNERPYAPADPRAHSFNQLTPYYDENIEAGSARSWDEQQSYTHRLPPPPSDYDLGRKPRPPARERLGDGRYDDVYGGGFQDKYDDRYSGRYDDRYDDRNDGRYDDRNDGRYDDRYDDRYDQRYDQRNDQEHDQSRDDDRSYDDMDRKDRTRHRRRRSAEENSKEKLLVRPGGRDALGGSESERGIAAKLIGGAGGALLGQTLGRGHTLETIAGAAVGVIAATALEKQIEKRKEDKVIVRRRSREGSAISAGPYPQSGRDTKVVRETTRDDGRRERTRSLSRRGTSSFSRRRPSDDRRRRSDSYDSVESLRREVSR